MSLFFSDIGSSNDHSEIRRFRNESDEKSPALVTVLIEWNLY